MKLNNKKTKSKILRAALNLFSSKGFYGTSIDEITKKAKVSHGLFFFYFKKKEDILIEIINHYELLIDNLINDIYQSTNNSLERIKIFFNNFFNNLLNNPDMNKYFIIGLQTNIIKSNPDLSSKPNKVFIFFLNEIINGQKEMLIKDGNPIFMALFLSSACFGIGALFNKKMKKENIYNFDSDTIISMIKK